MNESRYHVSLRTVLNSIGLLWDDDHDLDVVLAENDTLTLSLYGGSGGYSIKREHGGGVEYPVFIHHPNAVCEGGGVCKWCGTTLY